VFEIVSSFEVLEHSSIQVYTVAASKDNYERMCVWLINTMLGRRMILVFNGNTFRFNTVNERISWAIGFRKASGRFPVGAEEDSEPLQRSDEEPSHITRTTRGPR
jgi:hypothetical protein